MSRNKNRNEAYMKKAWEASLDSDCLKKKVGAVLVSPFGKILSHGWGGGLHTCAVCDKKKYTWYQDGCYAIHAEVRALMSVVELGVTNLTQHTVFVTHGPCDQCMKYMTYYRVSKVVYDEPYKTDYTKWIGYGIEVWHNDIREI